jgi:hypothetical protein
MYSRGTDLGISGSKMDISWGRGDYMKLPHLGVLVKNINFDLIYYLRFLFVDVYLDFKKMKIYNLIVLSFYFIFYKAKSTITVLKGVTRYHFLFLGFLFFKTK